MNSLHSIGPMLIGSIAFYLSRNVPGVMKVLIASFIFKWSSLKKECALSSTSCLPARMQPPPVFHSDLPFTHDIPFQNHQGGDSNETQLEASKQQPVNLWVMSVWPCPSFLYCLPAVWCLRLICWPQELKCWAFFSMSINHFMSKHSPNFLYLLIGIAVLQFFTSK